MSSFEAGAACVDGCYGNYTGGGWTYVPPNDGGVAMQEDQLYVPLLPAVSPPSPSGWSTIQPVPSYGGDGIPPVSAVPEPGTYALLAMGLVLMAAVLKRNRRRV